MTSVARMCSQNCRSPSSWTSIFCARDEVYEAVSDPKLSSGYVRLRPPSAAPERIVIRWGGKAPSNIVDGAATMETEFRFSHGG